MQKFTSAKTSINSKKVPAIFSHVACWKKGSKNFDLGGGRFNTATEYLKNKGVENFIFDPFNRTAEENEKAMEACGLADSVTLSNVLNVILEEKYQLSTLRQAKAQLKEDGKVFIAVYEGDKSGKGKITSAGFQHNKKLSCYVALVSQVFPKVKIINSVIHASN
jgi:hypothetical protein